VTVGNEEELVPDYRAQRWLIEIRQVARKNAAVCDFETVFRLRKGL
jgi:hypothetical protein